MGTAQLCTTACLGHESAREHKTQTTRRKVVVAPDSARNGGPWRLCARREGGRTQDGAPARISVLTWRRGGTGIEQVIIPAFSSSMNRSRSSTPAGREPDYWARWLPATWAGVGRRNLGQQRRVQRAGLQGGVQNRTLARATSMTSDYVQSGLDSSSTTES
jgi:hypothetical protein